MTRVIVESPYAGDVERNRRYLRACMRDCIARGESPYASHGLLTQPGVLNDQDPEERQKGILAGYAWSEVAHVIAFYIDLGISQGMQAALERLIHDQHGTLSIVQFRRLGGEWTR